MQRARLAMTFAAGLEQPDLVSSLADAGFTVDVHADQEALLDALTADRPDVVVAGLDLAEEVHRGLSGQVAERLVGTPVVALVRSPFVRDVVETLQQGMTDVVELPVAPTVLALTLDRIASASRMRRELRSIRRRARMDVSTLIGDSRPMQQLAGLIERVADRPTSVLVVGESGTGKELVARQLHTLSARHAGPFVAINCAAMPETLLESELFGHTRGAYTDAHAAREGLFVRSGGGTLFLDEIGDMPMSLQPKLLRALQDRVVRPVGSDTDVPFDTRVVAATHKDLDAAVAAGTFRADLLYRLDVVRLEVPPLRERGADVLLLAHHSLKRIATRFGRETPTLSAASARLVLDFTWPGNVRELQNCMERAVVMADGEVIEVAHLPHRLREPSAVTATLGAMSSALRCLADVERAHIERVLRACDGNKVQAAKVLGIDRKTLHRKVTQYASGKMTQVRQGDPPAVVPTTR